jgi:hypothetical protein
LQAQKLGIEGADKSASALEQAVNQMLQQAREYDTDLLEEMGVETIWLRDFDQMARFLQAIPGSTASGRVRSPRARSTVARRAPA